MEVLARLAFSLGNTFANLATLKTNSQLNMCLQFSTITQRLWKSITEWWTLDYGKLQIYIGIQQGKRNTTGYDRLHIHIAMYF